MNYIKKIIITAASFSIFMTSTIYASSNLSEDSLLPVWIDDSLEEDTTEEWITDNMYASDYINVLNHMENPSEHYKFYLIFVNEDNIPELVIDSGSRASGCIVYTWNDNNVESIGMIFPFKYIEKGNLLIWSDASMNRRNDYIWKIENGIWDKIGNGNICDETSYQKQEFNWNGNVVSEDEYRRAMLGIVSQETLDTAIIPENPMTYSEILSSLYDIVKS